MLFRMVGQVVAAQGPEIDIFQLVIVIVVELLEIVGMGRRVSDSLARLVGGGKTEAGIALELHRFLLQRVVDYHEDFLLAHFGHLDALFENAAAPFAKCHISFVRLFDFLRFVHLSASHSCSNKYYE